MTIWNCLMWGSLMKGFYKYNSSMSYTFFDDVVVDIGVSDPLRKMWSEESIYVLKGQGSLDSFYMAMIRTNYNQFGHHCWWFYGHVVAWSFMWRNCEQSIIHEGSFKYPSYCSIMLEKAWGMDLQVFMILLDIEKRFRHDILGSTSPFNSLNV